MPDTSSLCPLCGKDAKYLALDQKLSDTYNVRCDRCGEFKITWEALQVLKPQQKFSPFRVHAQSWKDDTAASNKER